MRGVFWIIEDELRAYPFEEGAEVGVARAGNTFNHRLLWEYVKPRKRKKPFDYYPRGRVDYDGHGRPVIYMGFHVDEEYVEQIKQVFELTEEPVIKYDGSDHYRCYLDW